MDLNIVSALAIAVCLLVDAACLFVAHKGVAQRLMTADEKGRRRLLLNISIGLGVAISIMSLQFGSLLVTGLLLLAMFVWNVAWSIAPAVVERMRR